MRLRRVLLPLLVILALMATACGSTSFDNVAAGDQAGTSDGGDAETPSTPADGEAGDDARPSTTAARPNDDGGPTSTAAGSDGDQTTDRHPDAQRLEQAAFATSDESYRAEMFMVMSMGAQGLDFDMGSDTTPIANIAYDGDNTAMSMDLGVMLGELFGQLGVSGLGVELDADDLRMDMVMTDDTMYLHSPFLGLPGAASGADAAWMQAAADGWVSISIEGLTASEALADFGEVSGLGTTTGVDQFFSLLDQVDDVEPLGPSQVRGSDVEGYRVTVSIEELMALQGASAEDLLGPEFVDLFEDFAYTFDAFVDDEGRLHAIDVVMDESLFDSFADQLGDESMGDFTFEMSMRLELFDHGSDEIDVPAPFGAVDVTEQFLASVPTGSFDEVEDLLN